MIFSGLMIPFLGTTLGAGMVFFMKGSMNQKLEKMLLGFAAGVMKSKVGENAFGICRRCYDCSFGVVASYTFN